MISVDDLKSLVAKSDNAVDFYMQAYNDYGDEVKKYFSDNKTTYKDFYDEMSKVAPKTESEWKEPNGTMDDWKKLGSLKININKFEVKSVSGGSATAHASKLGIIEINRKNHFSKQVFDHEIGHQLSNGNKKLQEAIILNYGNGLGRYNTRINKFDGAMGEYNPDEAFATCYSYYINYPSHLKSKFPDAYKVIDIVVKKITNLEDIQKGFYNAYKECFGEEIQESAMRKIIEA